jgi:hypothetical protein
MGDGEDGGEEVSKLFATPQGISLLVEPRRHEGWTWKWRTMAFG